MSAPKFQLADSKYSPARSTAESSSLMNSLAKYSVNGNSETADSARKTAPRQKGVFDDDTEKPMSDDFKDGC